MLEGVSVIEMYVILYQKVNSGSLYFFMINSSCNLDSIILFFSSANSDFVCYSFGRSLSNVYIDMLIYDTLNFWTT